MAGVRSRYTTPTGPRLLIDVAQAPHTHHGRHHHDSRPTATGWRGAYAGMGTPTGLFHHRASLAWEWEETRFRGWRASLHNAPMMTRRELELPSTTHRARQERGAAAKAAAERHAAAGAAARLRRRQERQRGVAYSGAESAARRRLALERKRPRQRLHAQLELSSTTHYVRRERVAAAEAAAERHAAAFAAARLPPRMAAARAPATGCNSRHPRRPAG